MMDGFNDSNCLIHALQRCKEMGERRLQKTSVWFLRRGLALARGETCIGGGRWGRTSGEGGSKEKIMIPSK
jgi:hypothetical protein